MNSGIDPSSLAEGQCLEFSIERYGRTIPCFAVRHAGRLFAYRNSCPHAGVELNWSPGVFLDSEGRHIQCSMHGALFSITTGACLYGPCRGQGLMAVSLDERDGLLWPADE